MYQHCVPLGKRWHRMHVYACISLTVWNFSRLNVLIDYMCMCNSTIRKILHPLDGDTWLHKTS